MTELLRAHVTRDPLERVLSLGDRAVRIGAAIGIAFALVTHTAASAKAMTALYDMLRLVRAERETLHSFFWATYDFEVDKAEKKAEPEKEKEAEKEPEPPPPDPTPEAAPAPKAEAAAKEDPYDSPPAPAKAAAVITAPEDPNDKIEDMTNTIVSGDGKATYGQVSASGKGDAPVTASNATLNGKPGGKGTGSAKGAANGTGVADLSKAPSLVGGSSWNCAFPPEADSDQIDEAVATITVTVRTDGTPASVVIVSDPGHGFGRAARQCALGRRFMPGLDRAGQAITMTTPQINVRFTR